MTPRRPTVRRLLTLCVFVSAIVSASHVHSEVSSLLDVTPAQFCERWRDNALLGARQQLRGASREVQYVNVSTLVEMIEHGIDRTKVPGARLSMHQDKNERDFSAPIVSVSLGLPAIFLLGGLRRADPPCRVSLTHGDVVVWGGPARLRYHGVLPLEAGHHLLMGGHRINLTFRRAA